MGRIYTIDVNALAVTGIVDFFEIVPAANKPLKVHAAFISQTSDVSDAQEEILQFSVHRGYTTTGGMSLAPTPVALDENDTAAAFTAKCGAQVVATGGTGKRLHTDSFNIRVGLALILPPEMRWCVDAGQNRLVLRITAPADAITCNGTLYVEEGP